MIKKTKKLSVVLCLLIIFNSFGVYASNVSEVSVNDEIILLSETFTERVVDSSYPVSYLQSRMGVYYSDYTTSANVYNNTLYGIIGDKPIFWDDGLQLRANCYGYAFRIFYEPEIFPLMNNVAWYDDDYGDARSGSYGQQPGEFAVKSSSNPLIIWLSDTQYCSVYDYASLRACQKKILGGISTTNTWRMSAMEQLLRADAAALGYTMTEYTGTTIPDALDNRNARMIAVTVTEKDYHFYMQHSDNTWSHKLGWGNTMDKCIDHSQNLTNDNIRSHACEGDYSGGALKFFYITKDATTDYSHRDGTASNQTLPFNNDVVGDHRFAAEDIQELPEDYIMGTVNYPGDVDFYSIYPSNSEIRDVSIESNSAHSFTLCVYDSNGYLIDFVTTSTYDYVTISFEADSYYYIVVSLSGNELYETGISYSFW